jgi:hypothetical protein
MFARTIVSFSFSIEVISLIGLVGLARRGVIGGYRKCRSFVGYIQFTEKFRLSWFQWFSWYARNLLAHHIFSSDLLLEAVLEAYWFGHHAAQRDVDKQTHPAQHRDCESPPPAPFAMTNKYTSCRAYCAL